MAITLTQAAATRIQDYMTKRGHGAGLQLSVKETGCSGYSYVMDYADQIPADSQIFESLGVQIFVDNESLKLIDGTQVDFKQQGLNAMFSFANPNITGECGCGESFNI